MRYLAVIVVVFFTLVACADRGITGPDRRTLQVVGRVTDCADDSPLAAASIRVYESRWVDPDLTHARTTTDENGHYEVSFSDGGLCDSYPAGGDLLEFVISASCRGYRTRARGGLMTDGVRCIEETQRFDFCLSQLQ